MKTLIGIRIALSDKIFLYFFFKLLFEKIGHVDCYDKKYEDDDTKCVLRS